MRTLNDPLPTDDDDVGAWSPRMGLMRAAWRGMLVAALFALLSLPILWYLPYMLMNFWLRSAFGFGLTLLMFGAVQSAAGMTGFRCSALAVVLVLLVLASHHAVLAVHGLPTTRSVLTGWDVWFNPIVLFVRNIPALGGLFIGTILCHSAGVSLGTLIDVLKMARIH